MYRKIRATLLLIAAMTLWFPYKACGGVSIRPSLEMEARYDSNFFSEGRSRNPEDTFVTTITPALRISYGRKNFSFDVFYGHNFRYLSRTDETKDDGVNRTSLSIDAPLFKRTILSVSDVFSYIEDSSTTSQDTSGTGIQTERTERITNTVSLAASHSFTPRTTARLTLSDYEEDFIDSSLIDSRRDSAGLVTTYQLTEKISTQMTYGYSLSTFDSAGGEQDTESHSLSLGITNRMTPTLSFSISGGASYTPEFEDNYSAIGQASLTKGFHQSSLSLAYSRGETHTSGLSDEISINDTYSARWGYTVSSTVNFSIYGSYSKYKSKPTGSVDTTSYTAGVNGGWRPYSWMNIGVGYSHLQQWVDGTLGEDLSRDQASVTITATPAGWSF